MSTFSGQKLNEPLLGVVCAGGAVQKVFLRLTAQAPPSHAPLKQSSLEAQAAPNSPLVFVEALAGVQTPVGRLPIFGVNEQDNPGPQK
ncbi:MAG TPA: hypothetical protein PKI03_32900, partial [Pseudomonadota bacterium]|nr:hypothetical protein [Pseudomonadota bacterium]